MKDKDYNKLAKEQVGDLFEIDKRSFDQVDDFIQKFTDSLKTKIEKTIKPSAIILASHAFAIIYENARLWLCLDGKNGLEIKFSFGDDSPSIFFEFDEVIDAISTIKREDDFVIGNINKAISALERLRGEIERKEFD